MVATKLKAIGDIVGMEQQATQFATAAALSANFTIPVNTGRIVVFCSGAVHWTPVGTATTTFAHAVDASEPFVLEHHQQGASIKSDSGSVTCTVAYMRGSQRPDRAFSFGARPY